MSTTTDVRRLVAAITHENTGYSPRVCERLQKICIAASGGDCDTRSLAEKLRLKSHQFSDPVQAGCELGLIRLVKQYRGGPGGRLPNLVRLDVSSLNRFEKATRPSQKSGISKRRLGALNRVDREKIGFTLQQWWHAARLAAAIGNERVASRACLAAELGISNSTLATAIRGLQGLDVLHVRRRNDKNGRAESAYLFDWRKLSSLPTAEKAIRMDLSPRFPRGTRPLEVPPGRISVTQKELLRDADWRKIGVTTAHQWLNVAALCGAIGDWRRVGLRELAKELRTSISTVEAITVRARRLGLVTCAKSYDNGHIGPRTMWNVHWERIANPLCQATATMPHRSDSAAVGWTAYDAPSNWEKVFGLSWKTLRRRISDGLLKAERKHGQAWRFVEADLPAVKIRPR